MITITKQYLDEPQYVATWGQRMHQKICHCLYIEGLCNAHFLFSENND